ncbi:MAG TPA: TIM44-like domain-containing protein [Solirubrobacteraceae bacterium]|nr:TIM44-like domain-containing protein [Solirubrobacteraceae bacterium]
MNRRRITIAILVALAVLLVLAPAALAGAGGGSSGFSGGGGEGGGGGGGGGGGVGLYILIQILVRIAVLGHGLGALVLVGLVVLALLYTNLAPRMRNFAGAQQSSGRAARRRTAHRERRVEAAAAEAAEDDPAFAPDVVRPAAAALFKDIQAAWDADDRRRLRELISPDLAAEWDRRLDDLERRGWRNHVQVLDEPTVSYVGLTNRGDEAADRVVVRIDARLRDYVEDRSGAHLKRTGRLSETVQTREFWTLGKRRGRWILLSIEQGAEGSHALDEQIVANPWSDEQAMRDESLVEGAVADAVPEGTKISEVADLDFDGDARGAALDLSLADARFAPDVLEVAARRAVAAWAQAVDGDDAELLTIAHRDAADQLLHPGDPSRRTRLVVRGPRVKQIRIIGLDAGATPPTMTVEVDLEGRRYIEDRDTAAVLSGSQSRATTFTERWTLALDGDAAQPWRIAGVGTPPIARA